MARCIPIISALERKGVEVFLASDGVALHLLRAEFPHLPSFELPSYKIRYDSANMVLNIGRQLPRILYAVRTEQWTTERLVREHSIEGIISDNRYGCFSRLAKSVVLTHQLHLRVPGHSLQWAANRVLRLALGRFDAVWVPDAADGQNLSGDLSHPPLASHSVRYIGPLSRLFPQQHEREYDVAVVLSGPEPQRSILETRLLEQAMLLPQKFIFVQGKTQSKAHHFVTENVEVVSYLTSGELNRVLAASHRVVCRAGYSSVMDLAAIGKKAILIPTPGQTEQEYLAEYLGQKKLFLTQSQEKIDLEGGLKSLNTTTGFGQNILRTDEFEETLNEWLK